MALRLPPAQHLKTTVATGLERARGSGGVASNRHALRGNKQHFSYAGQEGVDHIRGGERERWKHREADDHRGVDACVVDGHVVGRDGGAERHYDRERRQVAWTTPKQAVDGARAQIILDVTRAGREGAPGDLAGAATFAEGRAALLTSSD